MKRYHTQRFTLILLLCFIFFTVSVFSTTQNNGDKIIKDNYILLSSIQKQLNGIAKSIFINDVNETSNSTIPNQLNFFNNQLKEIKKNISEALTELKSLTIPQSNILHAMLTIDSYLEIIINEIQYLLKESDPSIQYDLYNTIFFINSLINQLLSFSSRVL
ncbi:MAG: hypothetical protein AB9856_02665 [Cellulosilyticaceae bacterium]